MSHLKKLTKIDKSAYYIITMAEGTSGPGAEGQPASLHPKAKADIEQALASAGAESLGSTPNKSDEKPYILVEPVEEPGQNPNKAPETAQNPWDNMPYKEMHVKNEPPKQGLSPDMTTEPQIYTPQPDKPPEFSDSRSAVGVTVRRVRAQGPRIMSENEPMGVQHQYDGLVVDMPDGRRITVVRGTLSGATFVQEYDKQGKEISSSELHGGLGALISKATETYSPSELPHLIDATVRMQKLEREQLKQKIEEAGGRDKYLMQEAQRLVKEGKYPNIEIARGVVLMQTEVYPTYPQTETAIEKAVNAGELPQDITDPEEVAKIRDELDISARYGLIDDFANKLPGLIRANSGNPVDKARFAFNLAKTLTETMLGKNNGVGNEGTSGVSFENAAQLSQMELDATKFSYFRPEYVQTVVGVLKYTWDRVSKIQQAAGLPSGKPRFKMI